MIKEILSLTPSFATCPTLKQTRDFLQGLKNSWLFPDGLFHTLNKSTHPAISNHLRYCSQERQLFTKFRAPIISLFILKKTQTNQPTKPDFLLLFWCCTLQIQFILHTIYISWWTKWFLRVKGTKEPAATHNLPSGNNEKKTFFLPRSPTFAFVTWNSRA